MHTTEVQNRRTATSLIFIILVFTWAFVRPEKASAQWATNGNNINNTNTGNVGIGNASPGDKLDVSGRVRFSIDMASPGNNIASLYRNAATGLSFSGYNGTSTSWYFANNLGQDVMYNPVGTTTATFAGNVGIGTTTPAQSLTVSKPSGLNYIQIDSGLNGGYIGTDGTNFVLQARNSGDITFYNAAGTARNFTVQNSGNVGIGTPSPGAALQVNIASSTTKGFIIKGAPSQSGNILEFQDSNGTVMSSFSPGGINTLSLGQNGYSGQILIGGAMIGNANGGKIFIPGGISVGTGIYDAYNTEMFSSGVGGVNFNSNTNATPNLIGFKFNANLASTTQKIASFQLAGTEKVVITYDGKVGIGTSSPQAALDVNGNINVSGNINAKYQDVAEWVPSSQKLSAGTVVILDPEKSNQVIASREAYDTRVAGVVSEQPGVLLGEGGEGKVKVATTGRVMVKVDATRGAIKIGDLLVTSDKEGVAMKSEPIVMQGRRIHAPGTIIGKALESLEGGVGEIRVLLSLQ